MKFTNRSLVLTLAASVTVAAHAMLSAEDYCDPKLNTPNSIKEMTPLNDGVSFAAISDDGTAIEVYSYKTGEKTSTLFSIDGVKGDVRIDSFDGYQLSANEKKILLWNNPTKIYRNSFKADYYVYDILRSTLKPVSEAGQQRGAVISHDGRMVAYQRDNNVFVSNLDYGSDKAVTTDGKVNEIIYGTPDWVYEEEFGMENSLRWSGDDSTLAFLRFDETDVPVYSFDEYGYYTSGNPLGNMYPPEYSYKYPLAGYPNSQIQVLAYNIDNRTIKKIDLQLDGLYVPSMEFDGAGENLMIMVLNRDQNDLKLYKANPGSTVARLVLSESSDTWLSPSAYQMVRYYPKSFVIGSERTGYRHLFEYDYNGNLISQLTSGSWNVTDYYGYCERTRTHYIQTTQNGAVNRNVASVSANAKVQMLNPVKGAESASFSKDFKYFVRKYSSVSVPEQYTICDDKGKLLKNLELNEKFAGKYSNAPKMELTEVRNADGEVMNAFIIKPNDFDPSRKYPLLMYQYNGPDSQLVLNAWKMDGIYYLASQGYIVAAADGRGTGNRSRDWATCVYRDLGRYETADQLSAASEFSALPYVDSERMACFGWSYGGYMTLMELADSKCPFKAGVAMAPVSDWRFYDSVYTERYMSTPQQNESGYNSSSALLKSGDIASRLLIMSGTSDDNVHFYNTLRYASKAFSEGKKIDMMALAGFEHSLRMTGVRTNLYKKIVDFLDLTVK